MYTPCSTHIEAVLRIVRYLKAHPSRDLFYGVHGHLRIEVFTNSDWVGSLSDMRSTQDIVPFYVVILSLEKVRSRQQLLELVQRPNSGL